MSQTGRVALVTGGAQGIGRAFVHSLLQEGAAVAICDLKEDVGEATAKEFANKFGENKVIFLQCDVTNQQQLEGCFKATIEKFSHLDIVVNNAGIANERDPLWRKVIDINFTAVVTGTKLALKYMGKNNGGQGGVVVNTASITSLEPWPSIPVYSATKAAVNQYSRSVGNELYFKKTGVKVMAINPGMTETPLTTSESALTSVEDDPELVQNFVTHFNSFYLQKTDNMGRGLIEVLQKGENGSLWTVENDEPAKLTVIK